VSVSWLFECCGRFGARVAGVMIDLHGCALGKGRVGIRRGCSSVQLGDVCVRGWVCCQAWCDRHLRCCVVCVSLVCE
jgi:hypothetical protein